MRVTVDRDNCNGHARCAAFAPAVFVLDAEDKSVVQFAEVPPDLEAAVRKAALACPELAVHIQE